jgi:hypothetical protein
MQREISQYYQIIMEFIINRIINCNQKYNHNPQEIQQVEVFHYQLFDQIKKHKPIWKH